MNVVKLGKKGQVSIPKAILERLGLEGEQVLTVEATDDGAIVLRPAGVYPIDIYSQERIEEFLAEDTLPPELERRARERLSKMRGQR